MIPRLLAVSIACGTVVSAVAQERALVTGTITYRERIALTPSATVEVRLEDVTRPGGASPVIARTHITNPGQVPIRFNLDYDTALIDPAGRYAVRATISDAGAALFDSIDTTLVLTQGHDRRADIVLTQVGSPRQTARPEQPAPPLPPNPLTGLPATFIGTQDSTRYQLNLFPDDSFILRTQTGESSADDLGSWTLSSDRRVLVLKGRRDEPVAFMVMSGPVLRRLDAAGQPMGGSGLRRGAFTAVDVRGSLRGAYTYMADAGIFVECSTGQRFSVAQEGANRDLEAAYSKARPAPGASIVVDVEGRLTARPRVEGRGSAATLVAERVERVRSGESCPARFSSAPLEETEWRLTHLGGASVPPAKDARRQPYLTFSAGDASFSGSSGCNRLIGTYMVSNATIMLKSGGTMIACREEAKTEAAFLAALEATRTFRVAGRTLELFDPKGTRLARFVARMPAGISKQ
jgi:uncharacterized lipoprotein YbaY/heat shock protein HslJ/uncharacterized lipoprotein NlpE involved in copper resistance